MENFVTFPSDPNVTQTANKLFGAESAGRERIRRLPEHFGRRRSHFSLFSSDTRHEAADLLRGFFFHACRDMGVHVQ